MKGTCLSYCFRNVIIKALKITSKTNENRIFIFMSTEVAKKLNEIKILIQICLNACSGFVERLFLYEFKTKKKWIKVLNGIFESKL